MFDNTHLQFYLELVFGSVQKYKSLVQTSKKKRFCLLCKENIAHLRHVRALRTWIIASAKRLKSPFVHAKYTRTHFVRTRHAPNKLNYALVVPTIRGECATHRNCSQLVLTFFCNVIAFLAAVVSFGMVKVDNFCMR